MSTFSSAGFRPTIFLAEKFVCGLTPRDRQAYEVVCKGILMLRPLCVRDAEHHSRRGHQFQCRQRPLLSFIQTWKKNRVRACSQSRVSSSPVPVFSYRIFPLPHHPLLLCARWHGLTPFSSRLMKISVSSRITDCYSLILVSSSSHSVSSVIGGNDGQACHLLVR